VDISSTIGPYVRIQRKDILEIYFPPSKKPEVKRTLIFKTKNTILGHECGEELKSKRESLSEKLKGDIHRGLSDIRRSIKRFIGKIL